MLLTIEGFPEKFDTVGERGVKLSGGQDNALP
jgi:ABC-type multidrug transport system fused ATPase/permease subunit